MAHPTHQHLFHFEIASSENLLFIPLCVRFHLDRTATRISLAEWQQLPWATRARLASFPVGTTGDAIDNAAAAVAVSSTAEDDFTACLHAAMVTQLGHAAEHSGEGGVVVGGEAVLPGNVRTQCTLAGLTPPSDDQWNALSRFQRYALAKLSRKPTPNHDFLPAMQEFGLAE